MMSNADTRIPCFHIPDRATLLLVEDDASVRRSLRRLLNPHRTTLVEAADGEHAIRLIEQDEAQLLDVVLTDLRMPVVSGSELIAVLLECRPALPIVAMSGSIDFPPDLLPVPLLRKPIEPEQLVRTVAPLVLASQAMRERAWQMSADAADSRSLADRQRATARGQMTKRGDLMVALTELRRRMALQRPLRTPAARLRPEWLEPVQ